MEYIKVAFLTGSTKTDVDKVNYWTRVLTGDYIHCEIVFKDHKSGKHNLSCSIVYGRSTYMEVRDFSRDEWSFVKVTVTKHEYHRIKRWCEDQVKAEIPFNSWGFYRAITPFPRSTDGTCWFCSEMVCTAFQQIGHFKGAVASTMSPTDLKEMMEKEFSVSVDMSPNVEARIKTKGLRFGGAISAVNAQTSHASLLKHTWNDVV
tara:strand:+ start:1432 stop:2043 length:612 start_codon:yes stop_codon:yes gene_type:complete